MVVFPNCKINLGLNIIRKRSDGFHDIETAFFPIQINDALEAIPGNDPGSQLSFTTSGLAAGEVGQNLCVRAFQLVQKDFPQLGSISMHLHKVIPIGAGLGGGSADGAFTLKLLNDKFGLGIGTEKLMQYALQLGSDCPFFIINKPCMAIGRGEILTPLQLDLSDYKIVIVNPAIKINTSEVFSSIAATTPYESIENIVKKSVENWPGTLRNDFEPVVFAKFPEIKKIKEDLYELGAVYASLTGSGSTVFGIYKKDHPLLFQFPGHYVVKCILL